jgi:hypothetical protein
LLRAFALVHLEEEIRREAFVKDWGAFVRFMQLAAAESGQILNFAGISQETGVSQPTVKSYYQLLEDMFVGFQVEAFSRIGLDYHGAAGMHAPLWHCVLARQLLPVGSGGVQTHVP